MMTITITITITITMKIMAANYEIDLDQGRKNTAIYSGPHGYEPPYPQLPYPVMDDPSHTYCKGRVSVFHTPMV